MNPHDPAAHQRFAVSLLPAKRLAAGIATCSAAVAFALPATAQQASASLPLGQPALPRIQLNAGIHLIQAEIAADPATRARGLMFRQSLGTSEGMLFVFQHRDTQCFWMRNTLIALSIAFLNDDGTVVNVADMAPQTETSHCSAQPVRYALEMNQGWFTKRGLDAQSVIEGLPR